MNRSPLSPWPFRRCAQWSRARRSSSLLSHRQRRRVATCFRRWSSFLSGTNISILVHGIEEYLFLCSLYEVPIFIIVLLFHVCASVGVGFLWGSSFIVPLFYVWGTNIFFLLVYVCACAANRRALRSHVIQSRFKHADSYTVLLMC